MKRISINYVLLVLAILALVACQKDNASKLKGTWKITHQTEVLSSVILGEADSDTFNYDLTDSDLYLTFEVADSDNAVLEEGTVTMTHGLNTSSTGFTYSSTSKKIAFKRSFSVSSVSVKDEDEKQIVTTTFSTYKEYDVQQLTSKKMVLFNLYQNSLGSSIQAKAETTVTLSKVK